MTKLSKLQREHARCKRVIAKAKKNKKSTNHLYKDFFHIGGEILREENKKALPLFKRAA